MTLWLACLAALALATITAAILARHVPAYRPAAAVLAWGLAVDLVLGHRDAWGLGAYLAGRVPYQGADVWLYHVSHGLETSWPAAVAALAWWALGPQKAKGPGAAGLLGGLPHQGDPNLASAWTAVKAIFVAWVAANVALVLAWPIDRPHAQRALHVVELGAVAVGFAAWRFRRLAWTPVQRTALWLLVVELVVALLGPYRTDIYERWYVARVAYLGGFGVLAMAQLFARRDRG